MRIYEYINPFIQKILSGHKKRFPLVSQEGILLVSQEDISSYVTKRKFCLCPKTNLLS